ncbi:PEP-CTERM sorting domain-containing protein [Bythopirellula polymerisocia]|uniref:Ice-binding protein C-terminal domain-containing protein n=1 Tax=Bythopirellula polymerisocia TaxID=2528003 RepID=A0A5C6CNM7_9BACT|nr:PEP-CTERM sorting domain-containing protein [Bythopirellula polymerisocia]TWU26130.1 hypothetical protein Pla144_33470 [Bythopirellula polymerisocia]
MMTTTRKVLSALLVCALISSSAMVTQAGTINHGDFMGAGVAYTSVTESSNTDSVPLFGTPVVIGNQLRFFEPVALPNPSLGFGASSVSGASDVTDGFLSFMVQAKPGLGIGKIGFREGGDYSLAGFPGDQAKVIANLIIQSIRIDEVDGVAIAPISLSGLESTMAQLGVDPAAGPWSNMKMFSIDAALANIYPPTSSATKLTVRLNDSLLALTQGSGIANIVKKMFNVDVDTRINENTVPEPTSMALVMLGVVAFASTRRR